MMNRLAHKLLIAAAVLSMVAVYGGCSRERGPRIVIKGSTTVLPITQKVVEEYRKTNKVSISISGDGSGNGIKALLDGSCDIANSSREMKPEELKKAEDKGIRVREIVVAYDMIVPVVHPSNGISDITLDQLKAVYDGSLGKWKDIGGTTDDRIVVISRDTSSGTYEVWESMVMKKVEIRKDALLQASNGAILTTVAENPKAIGYIGYGYINKTVKPLRVNGVVGTIENGKSGKFPISRKLYMYVNEGALKTPARAFIDYLLGAEGQRLVREAGFIPLK